MDANDPRRRQSNPSGYASQQGLLQTSPQYPATTVSDRYRSSQLGLQSPTSAPTAGRGGNIQGYSYGYGESSSFGGSSMNPATLSYPAEYSQETQRPTQQYGQYGSNIMYNVPSQQQAPTHSPYENVQQYQQPRQSAAIEVLSNQFGVPQQYYGAGESGPTSAPMPSIGGQNAPSQYSQMSYSQPSSAPREAMPSAYSMAETSQSGQTAYGQSSYSMSGLDSAYEQYQSELKKTFESIRDGRLVEAGSSLREISSWLLGNAEALGLVRDEEGMHAERLKLWKQFNTAWLSALQTQKEMTIQMLETGHRPQPPRTIMETEQMEDMGKELVKLCDSMEKHGLVDYEMGVWEEDIVSLLSACLDLLDEVGGGRASSTQRR